MTNERFAEEIIALTDTLYRVSYSILRDKYDREDAVQSCLEKAWKKRRALRDERLVQTLQALLDAERRQQLARHARVLGAHRVRVSQSVERARRHVAEVPQRRGNDRQAAAPRGGVPSRPLSSAAHLRLIRINATTSTIRAITTTPPTMNGK